MSNNEQTNLQEGTSNKIVLLVDGDIVAYKTACMKDDDGNLLDIEAAKWKVDSWLTWLQDRLQSSSMRVFLTGKTNFRREIYPAYKDNRDPTTKPELLGPLKEYLVEAYGAILKEGLEADDLLGMATCKAPGETKVIVSIDKDFNQIPGFLFNPNKIEDGIREISLFEADQYFYLQWLTGDSTDGYPGVPGVGPKKAAKIIKKALEEAGENDYRPILEKAILAEYTFHSLSKEFALAQARVARILRPFEFCYDDDKPLLWGSHLM